MTDQSLISIVPLMRELGKELHEFLILHSLTTGGPDETSCVHMSGHIGLIASVTETWNEDVRSWCMMRRG